MGLHRIDQAGLEFLTSGDPPASASQSAGITGVSHCVRQEYDFNSRRIFSLLREQRWVKWKFILNFSFEIGSNTLTILAKRGWQGSDIPQNNFLPYFVISLFDLIFPIWFKSYCTDFGFDRVFASISRWGSQSGEFRLPVIYILANK